MIIAVWHFVDKISWVCRAFYEKKKSWIERDDFYLRERSDFKKRSLMREHDSFVQKEGFG